VSGAGKKRNLRRVLQVFVGTELPGEVQRRVRRSSILPIECSELRTAAAANRHTCLKLPKEAERPLREQPENARTCGAV
jgi:hypothetical protein